MRVHDGRATATAAPSPYDTSLVYEKRRLEAWMRAELHTLGYALAGPVGMHITHGERAAITASARVRPLPSTQYVFRWRVLHGAVPDAHQRGEAVADLMDTLRSQGLVLLDGPALGVEDDPEHGRLLVLTCRVRPMTDVERAALNAPTAKEVAA